MSYGQRRGARQRGADRLRDPPPVRVAAVQRRLDERRVGDRAGDPLDGRVVAAVHVHAADPLGALAVAHDLQREPAQRVVERLAEPQLVLATPARRSRRSRPTRSAAPCRWSRAGRRRRCARTSASRRRRAAAPRSRAASAASVWTKHSIVAKPGWIIPAPFAWALTADRARRAARRRARAASRTRPSSRSRARTRRRRRGASSPRAARIAFGHAVHRQRHADHAGRRDRDAVLAHAGRHRGGALHPRGVLEPAVAGRGVGVAGVDDDRAQRVEPAARLAQQHRRGQHARAREARRADRVGLGADQQREVGIARRLDPRAHAGGAEAARRARRPVARSRAAGGSTQREAKHASLSSPSRSSRPNIRLRFWTACEAAPFQRLSIAANTRIRPVRGSQWTDRRQ